MSTPTTTDRTLPTQKLAQQQKMAQPQKMAPRRNSGAILLLLTGLTLTSLVSGCAAHRAMAPTMAPLPLERPAPLAENHFKTDRSAVVAEDAIHRILEAPVFLEANARVGVVPVATGYAPDRDLPLATVPAAVSEAMTRSGQFEVTTEVSTDWPAGSGVAGLRELAARYRCEYLLLYRHRFVHHEWTNGWGAMWLTVVGGFFVPMNTIQTAGVLEATLFDVRTGTLLFTVYQRVDAEHDENVWQNDRKRRAHKEALLAEGADGLARQVVTKVGLLAAARPESPAPTAETRKPASETTPPTQAAR